MRHYPEEPECDDEYDLIEGIEESYDSEGK